MECALTLGSQSQIELNYRTPSWCSQRSGELLGVENPIHWCQKCVRRKFSFEVCWMGDKPRRTQKASSSGTGNGVVGNIRGNESKGQ